MTQSHLKELRTFLNKFLNKVIPEYYDGDEAADELSGLEETIEEIIAEWEENRSGQ